MSTFHASSTPPWANGAMTPEYSGWLAIAIEVLLADPDDRERIERERRGAYRPTWRLVANPSLDDSEARLMFIAPVGRMGTRPCRALVYPVRADHPLWSQVREGDDLTLLVQDHVAGQGSVKWIADMDSGLHDGQRHALVHWGATGHLPEFRRLSPED
jgi:hypothetical protein